MRGVQLWDHSCGRTCGAGVFGVLLADADEPLARSGRAGDGVRGGIVYGRISSGGERRSHSISNQVSEGRAPASGADSRGRGVWLGPATVSEKARGRGRNRDGAWSGG